MLAVLSVIRMARARISLYSLDVHVYPQTQRTRRTQRIQKCASGPQLRNRRLQLQLNSRELLFGAFSFGFSFILTRAATATASATVPITVRFDESPYERVERQLPAPTKIPCNCGSTTNARD